MRNLALIGLAAVFSACGNGLGTIKGDDVEIMVKPGLCRGSSQGDNQSDCSIIVIAELKDGNCDLKVEAAQSLVSFAKGAGGKWIHWEIRVPSDFTFSKTPSGIRFANDGKANFTNPKWEDGGLTYRWKNRNGREDAGDFKYDIEVVDAKGKRCILDPVIRNR